MSENVLSIAALSVVLSSKSVFRILPAGLFRAADGRPGNGQSWQLTPEIGAQLVRNAEQAATDYPFDYEHQTLESAKNGMPAPAAGWFKKLEWRPDGLYVTDARWTDRARDMIDQGEYRFVSPVFTYNPNTFAVRELHSIALTNKPALLDLVDLAALSQQGSASGDDPSIRSAVMRSMGLTPEQFDAGYQAEPQNPSMKEDILRRMGMTPDQFDAGLETEPVDPAPDRSRAALDNLVRQLLPKQ